MQLNMSARIIAEEAIRLGYKVEQYESKHLIKVTKGGEWVFFNGSCHSKQSSVGKTIADFKNLTRQILTKVNLPMAKGGMFFTKEEGLEFARDVGWPLVYKPTDGRHGRGVVVGIDNEHALTELIGEPTQRGYILEQVLQGKDFRVVVIGHKFFCATHREPAYVVGDGENTIEQLVEAENKNPERGDGHEANLTKITIDSLGQAYLQEQGMTAETIASKGRKIYLRKTAGLSTGGVGIDVTDEVGEENKRLFEKVARECDLSLVGIDVMAETLVVPITSQQKAGIIELNASPGLRMHHYPFKGETRNVAGKLLVYVFS